MSGKVTRSTTCRFFARLLHTHSRRSIDIASFNCQHNLAAHMPALAQLVGLGHVLEREDGIISRHVYREVPPKVEYSLTDFGKSLQPILIQMRDWGQEYMQTLLEKKRRVLA